MTLLLSVFWHQITAAAAAAAASVASAVVTCLQLPESKLVMSAEVIGFTGISCLSLLRYHMRRLANEVSAMTGRVVRGWRREWSGAVGSACVPNSPARLLVEHSLVEGWRRWRESVRVSSKLESHGAVHNCC